MLKDFNAVAAVAVKDPDRARRFYRDTLGLDPLGDQTDVLGVFRAGSSRLVVYPSKNAGASKVNSVVWSVGEAFDEIAAALRAKGVEFLAAPDADYMECEGNIYQLNNTKFAWFKDPDGNVLNITSLSASE